MTNEDYHADTSAISASGGPQAVHAVACALLRDVSRP